MTSSTSYLPLSDEDDNAATENTIRTGNDKVIWGMLKMISSKQAPFQFQRTHLRSLELFILKVLVNHEDESTVTLHLLTNRTGWDAKLGQTVGTLFLSSYTRTTWGNMFAAIASKLGINKLSWSKWLCLTLSKEKMNLQRRWAELDGMQILTTLQ